ARLLLHPLRLRLGHLVWRYVAYVLPERPLVTKGIDEVGHAIAPEHVHRWRDGLGAGLHRAIEGLIDVFTVDHEARGRPVERLWRRAAPLRVLVAEHDDGVADANLGVHHLAVGRVHAHGLLGAEGLLVERNGLGRVADGQIRRDDVVALGNRLHLAHD